MRQLLLGQAEIHRLDQVVLEGEPSLQLGQPRFAHPERAMAISSTTNSTTRPIGIRAPFQSFSA